MKDPDADDATVVTRATGIAKGLVQNDTDVDAICKTLLSQLPPSKRKVLLSNDDPSTPLLFKNKKTIRKSSKPANKKELKPRQKDQKGDSAEKETDTQEEHLSEEEEQTDTYIPLYSVDDEAAFDEDLPSAGYTSSLVSDSNPLFE